MTGDALTRLARFVAADPLEPDPATLGVLRDGVIDTLGCIHAGARTEVAARSRSAIARMGAPGPALVIGGPMRAARPHAAFLNAIAGHALDFDDWEIPGNTHPTVVILPALLAVADARTSGGTLAQAYLAGYEVIARLGEGLNFQHYDAGWHSTATLGALGAAAACSRLIGLDVVQIACALSLACSAASGFTCQFGTNAKPTQAGFAARTGVEAALLAQAGMTAQTHVLDHPRGFAALMGGLRADNLDRSLSRLGKTYALTEHGLVLKPWPSCGYTHRIMTSALALRNRLSQSRISSIVLHLPDFHAAVLPFGQPSSRPEALFSAPFVAAMGLARGGLSLADLESRTWEQAEIAGLIAKTAVCPFKPVRPDLNYAAEDPDRFIVTVDTGDRYEERCIYPLGAPQAPMSTVDLLKKFNTNLGPISEAHSSRQIWTARLQNWPEASSVLNLFLEQGPIQ